MKLLLTLLFFDLCTLSIYGKVMNDSVCTDMNLFSFYVNSKEQISVFTYSIKNVSNEILYLWFDNAAASSNPIKRYFLTKKGDTSLFQIATETNAVFECVLLESFVKKITPGMNFKLEILSTGEISEEDIGKITFLLNQVIVIASESAMQKEIKGFSAISPQFFCHSSSLVLPIHIFYRVMDEAIHN